MAQIFPHANSESELRVELPQYQSGSLTAMPLELQDVEFGDGKEIAYVYISAFYDDPFQKTLYSGMSFDKQVTGVISRWRSNFGDLSAHYKKVVDTDTGKIVSYSKWSLAFTNGGPTLGRPKGGLELE